jgi:hypothetical protein
MCDAGVVVDGSGPDAGDAGPTVDTTLIACGSQMCSAQNSEYCLLINGNVDGSATPSTSYACTIIPVLCTPTPTCACLQTFSGCDSLAAGATFACTAESGNVLVTCSP